MADQNGAPADAGAQGTPTPGSTPTQAPAEAGKTGTDVEYWKAEAKAAFAKRDKALEEHRASDEYKALMAKAAKADEYERAQAEAARKEAEQRGEWKRLWDEGQETWTKERSALEAQLAAEKQAHSKTVESYKEATAKSRIEKAYRDAGGKPSTTFGALMSQWLTDKTVSVADDGSLVGVADAITRLHSAEPWRFTTSVEQAREHLRQYGVRVEDGPGSFQGRDETIRKQQEQTAAPMSLTEFARARIRESSAKNNGNGQRFNVGGKPSGE